MEAIEGEGGGAVGGGGGCSQLLIQSEEVTSGAWTGYYSIPRDIGANPSMVHGIKLSLFGGPNSHGRT
jgi:hypothetical protein